MCLYLEGILYYMGGGGRGGGRGWIKRKPEESSALCILCIGDTSTKKERNVRVSDIYEEGHMCTSL